MGIRDFFRKQVKEEEKKIIKKRYTASDEITKKQLKAIRNEAAKNVLKKDAKILTGVTVSCVALGIAGVKLVEQNNMKRDLKEDVTHENTITCPIDNPVKQEPELDILLGEIDSMESAEEALEFFKKIYVEEYNKDHNTNIKEEDISFYSQNQAWMYDVGDKCVSRGSYPEGVELKLQNQNIDYEKREDLKKMYSVIIKDENGENKFLESITLDKENILPVITGEEYLDGKELNSDEINTLSKQGKLIEYSVDLVMSYKNGYSNDSYTITKQKEKLEEEVKKNEQRKMDEQIKADIEAGVR